MNEITAISCSWKQLKKSGFEETKCGLYSQSYFWDIKDFGIKKWVVLGYIEGVNWKKEIEEYGKSFKEIVDGCLFFLNIPEERKKYQKKESKSKYGELEPYKVDFKDEHIIIQCIINEPDNPNFWGSPPILNPNGLSENRRTGKRRDPKKKIQSGS